MWFNLLGMAVKTGADVYKRKQETKSLIALAERNHAEKMSRGEITYQGKVMDNQNQGIKDEIVLFIVILPIVVISYSVFSGTPNAKEKLDLFFEYFNNLPDWYVWLTVGIFGSIYGLKPGLDIFKKKQMSDNTDILNEYKDQIRILKQEIAELQDAGKSKDSANKRCLQKLEHIDKDLEVANKKIKDLEEEAKEMLSHP